MDSSKIDPVPAADQPNTPAPAVLEANQIFRGAKEVIIQHQGVRYRLRVTRRGKLILQK